MARQIHLTQGYVTLVDDVDYEWLKQWKWCAHVDRQGCVYAVRSVWVDGRNKMLRMHRLILGAKPGKMSDHINGDTLDNRRSNLRICTNQQNNRNRHARAGTSRYKGVHWYKRGSKWRASIHINGRFKHLGYFDDEQEAALAYDRAARELFGEFANPNFPEEVAA